jgi:predicted RNA-binding Zn ribbon-like protein
MPKADTTERFDWPRQGLAIDLADTVVVVRAGETIDHLSTMDQLGHWLEMEHRWLDPAGADAPERIEDYRELRDAIRVLCFASLRRQSLPGNAIQTLNRYAAAAPWFRQLQAGDGELPRLATASAAVDRTDRTLASIADGAIALLGGSERERLRVCEAPSCGMFFLAGSPRQLWCRDACGNRARVARFHARTLTNPGRAISAHE